MWWRDAWRCGWEVGGCEISGSADVIGGCVVSSGADVKSAVTEMLSRGVQVISRLC